MTPSPPRGAQSSRRRFIRLAGGGVVLAAASPLAVIGCAAGMPTAALQPWSAPTDTLEIREFMLAYALLAPNPHNRQPWIADLREPRAITLFCDSDRLLPETDPFGRQIMIGCGAFLELAVQAAAQRGRAVQVSLFPDGEPPDQTLPRGVRVARLVFGEPGSAEPDPLFAQVLERRTHKGAYDNQRVVAAPLWQRLYRASAAQPSLMLGHVSEPARMTALRHLTRTAFEIELLTPATYLESARLLRIGPTEIERHRDGISITGTMPRLLDAVGLFDRFEVPRRGTDAHRRMLDYWKPFETGSGYFWIATQGNRRGDQLAVGRAFVRAQLQATADGLSLHPLSQALQEFDAMREPRRTLHAALGLDPAAHTLQMLSRVGYALEPAGHSPRRALSDLLRA
jgi:hypothetical protein